MYRNLFIDACLLYVAKPVATSFGCVATSKLKWFSRPRLILLYEVKKTSFLASVFEGSNHSLFKNSKMYNQINCLNTSKFATYHVRYVNIDQVTWHLLEEIPNQCSTKSKTKKVTSGSHIYKIWLLKSFSCPKHFPV